MAVASDSFQIFVRLLDNKTLTLQFPIQPPITGEFIKQQVQSLAQIPSQFQKLTLNGRFIDDQTLISQKLNLSTIQLNFSLLGGKGGFGSLLRGAATKAGQKKTNNFDACRDMSGRRLRHVNAEKKLEEWMSGEAERKLEKVAEDYLKKMAKTHKKKKGGDDAAEKYVQKYREESAKCLEEVERSVRESAAELMVGKKRKMMEKLKLKAGNDQLDAKKAKIWMGKRAMGESDSDDTDEEEGDSDNAENGGSVVIDNGSHSDSSKELEGSSRASSAKLLDVACAGRSSESSSEEEKDSCNGGSSEVSGSPRGSEKDVKGNGIAEPSSDGEEHKTDNDEKLSGSQDQHVFCSVSEVDKEVSAKPIVFQPANSSASLEQVGTESAPAIADGNEATGCKSVVLDIPEVEVHPIHLNGISSAAELEVFGLEKLKTELQKRGLKCGGTLQERAARLFLLKTTPIEKIPKKLLAKK